MTTRHWRRWLPLAILAGVAVSGVSQAQEAMTVRVTYYLPTGNRMANGEWPYYGAAACSYNLAFGTRLRFPDGAEFVCADRGQLGGSGWADLYAPTPEIGRGLARRYGDWAQVEIIR